MRTSKISQETSRIFSALSANAVSRTTRSKKTFASFALGYDGALEVKEEESAFPSDADVPATPDIEDVFTATGSTSKKRKRDIDSPAASTRYVKHEVRIKTEYTSPLKPATVPSPSPSTSPSPTPTKAKARRRIPARRTTSPGGTTTVQPPADWEELYNIVATMRRNNPTAPVDTMGCEDLFWASAPPAEKRYHTLTALMLSSQTKDTVTAAAMQRLHTELLPQQPSHSDNKPSSSSLTIANILSTTPTHLNSLISKVGFHNNKTNYIRSTAAILASEYNHDIPSTIEGLVRLPGVGPKMAYLCMSAAWGIDVGIGVDVHVHRITNLWGWHDTKNPEETRAKLESWLPREKWHEINKMLVGLGQTVCLPVGRRCGECDLAGTGLCKAEIRGWKDGRKGRVKIEKVEVKEKIEVEVKEGVMEN